MINKEEIIRRIEAAGPLGARSYVTVRGSVCAIGALLSKATREKLVVAVANEELVCHESVWAIVGEELKALGLTPGRAQLIQDTNDWADQAQRLAKVVDRVKALEDE